MVLEWAVGRVQRDPAVIGTAVAGACGTVLGARVSGRRGTSSVSGAALVGGAILGALVGGVARRWTWSAARVEDELMDAELVLQSADEEQWSA